MLRMCIPITSTWPRQTIQIPRGVVRPYTALFFVLQRVLLGIFLQLEKESCKRRNVSLLHPGGRLFKALLQLAVLLGICAWFASPAATLAALAGIVTAKLLVEMFNYYQHYGLVRVLGSNYGQQHLWNHLKPISRQLSFEITNHNDHHMDSYLPFYRLQPKVDGPQMPSILLCFLAGLVPPIWFSYIHNRD